MGGGRRCEGGLLRAGRGLAVKEDPMLEACNIGHGAVGVTACPRVLTGATEQAPTDFGVLGLSPRSFGRGGEGCLPGRRSTTALSPVSPCRSRLGADWANGWHYCARMALTGGPRPFAQGRSPRIPALIGVRRSESRDGPFPSAESARHCLSGHGGNGEATLFVG